MFRCLFRCVGSYIKGSLRNLITKGKGQPNPLEKVVAKAREMSSQDYTTSFTVSQTPNEAFDAINNVRGWWSGEVEGNTDKLGAEFTYQVPEAHRSKQKVTELVPGKKVVWHVSDAHLGFVENKSEWKGTDIVFDIAKNGDKTEVRFTHKGLVPAYECYNNCSNAWGSAHQRQFAQADHHGQASAEPVVKGAHRRCSRNGWRRTGVDSVARRC